MTDDDDNKYICETKRQHSWDIQVGKGKYEKSWLACYFEMLEKSYHRHHTVGIYESTYDLNRETDWTFLSCNFQTIPVSYDTNILLA